jgi:hypothetical protein
MTDTTMSTPPSTAQRTGTVYHWVMTVQTAHGVQGSFDGTTPPLPYGTTRTAYYRAVRELMAEKVGTDQFAVLLFVMEPDTL